MIQNRKLRKGSQTKNATKKKRSSEKTKKVCRAQSPVLPKAVSTDIAESPSRVHTVSPTNSEISYVQLPKADENPEMTATHGTEASNIRYPRACTMYHDILKEDLFLSSIKRKQAVTRELIKLHEQTAYLKVLRAKEQNPLLLMPQSVILQPSFGPKNLNFIPIPHSTFF